MQLPLVSARKPQPSRMIRTNGVFLSIDKLSILNERQQRLLAATIRTNAQSAKRRAVERVVARSVEARLHRRTRQALRSAFRRDHTRWNLFSRTKSLPTFCARYS